MTKVELIKRRCNCHPETCCCHDYHILVNGEKVAEGSDHSEMQRLTLLAQLGALQSELESKGVKL